MNWFTALSDGTQAAIVVAMTTLTVRFGGPLFSRAVLRKGNGRVTDMRIQIANQEALLKTLEELRAQLSENAERIHDLTEHIDHQDDEISSLRLIGHEAVVLMVEQGVVLSELEQGLKRLGINGPMTELIVRAQNNVRQGRRLLGGRERTG